MRPERLLVLAASILFALPIVSFAQDLPGRGAEFQVIGPSYFALQVQDDSISAAWYHRVLGLDEIRHIEAEDGRYSIRILSRPGLAVELIRLDGVTESPDRHFGLFKTGFYVDNAAAALEWLKARKVDTDDQLFLDDALQVRSFVFRDLNGSRLQVFEQCDPDCRE